jgi:hypothetical protein
VAANSWAVIARYLAIDHVLLLGCTAVKAHTVHMPDNDHSALVATIKLPSVTTGNGRAVTAGASSGWRPLGHLKDGSLRRGDFPGYGFFLISMRELSQRATPGRCNLTIRKQPSLDNLRSIPHRTCDLAS